MNKMLLKMGFGWLVLAGIAGPALGAPGNTKSLHGHVPAVISNMAPLGLVDATTNLHLAIGLQLRNQDRLTSLIQQVSDPASPNYRHYLTTEEFTAQFGPTEEDVAAVRRFAEENHLIVKRVHNNRMLLEVDGQAADVERAFNVTLRNYHLAAENRDFYAPDQEPTVSASSPILDVQGLNSYVQPHPRIRTGHVTSAKNAKAPPPATGSGNFGTFLGNDFRPAYVPGTTLTGTGQNVALFEYDGYLASDITQYLQLSGITSSVLLTNILLQNFDGIPQFGGQSEVTLDIDMILAMAPGVTAIQVYEGNFGVAYLPNLVLGQIANDNAARQISCSWGWMGGPSATTDQLFEQMILQGQTFYDAVGDVCAFLPPGQPGSVDDPNRFNAPSDSPFITQVGGTTLTTTGPGGSFVSETVWNWGIEFGNDGQGGSGGISGFYPIPTWQTNVNMSGNQGSTTMRNTPDVAMTADNIDLVINGIDIASQGSFEGGTSAAAPLWAGFTALVNQQAANYGLGVVGFINPALYSLARTNSSSFRDVVTGNNTWSRSPNEFFAVPGFDLCTGWGSPNGTNLINLLATPFFAPIQPPTPVIPAPKQPWGNTLSVMNGGDPNGLWLLFLQDDTLNGYSGTNYNGWSVNLTTANPVGFAADNQLYINTTNITVPPGSQWITTLAVTNYGPSISTNVFVSDLLPSVSGATLISSNSTVPGSTMDIVGGILTWNVGTLPVNAGGTLSLTFRANAVGVYTNGASVNATTLDPNPDDDSVGVNIAVGFATPPSIFPAVVRGGGGAFQLSVTNDAGATIIIQGSTNLTTWVPIVTNVAPFTFTNFDTTNFPLRFYRAVTSP